METRATYWEGSGRETAAVRIMGRKAVERVGCDRLGKFMGRMGEIHGKNERDSWEEWERILGRRGVNTATFREGYYGSSGELLRQIGRITGNIGSAYIIIIGEIVAVKGRERSDI